MSEEAIVRTADPNRGGKRCRCARCGRVEVCSPFRDFYQQGYDPDEPIVCERCIITKGCWETIPDDWRTRG